MKIKIKMTLLALLVLSLNSIMPIQAQAEGEDQSQTIDMNAPIFPAVFWDSYGNEATALAKAENGSLEEQRKAAVTFFVLSRETKDEDKALDLARQASEIINSLYRDNRDDLLLGLLAAEINMAVAGSSGSLIDRIRYTNRGLANFKAALPSVPDNLEAKQLYLRTTIYIPKYFKNLTSIHWEKIQEFIDGYDAGMEKLESPEARLRLKELKTQVMIMAAHIANDSKKTRGDVQKYLSQVDRSFFKKMQKRNQDLIDMYEELQK